MKGDLISIIIPTYNVVKYIGKCLDSLIQQTYSNIEIIIIDDGSTDGTSAICDEYLRKDSRIQVFHILNSGVSNARNYGLDKAKGKWFAFVDADDWVDSDCYECLLKNAVNTNSEISACCYSIDKAGEISQYSVREDNLLVFETSADCIHNFICQGISMEGMVWNKIYLKDKFEDIKFDTSIQINEDSLYTLSIMKKCDRACLTTKKMYHWVTREESACRKIPNTLVFNDADVFLEMINKTEYLNDSEIYNTLVFNYAHIVINKLIYVKYRYDSAELIDIQKRLILWNNIYYEKLDPFRKKYCNYVLYHPTKMNICRFFILFKHNLKSILKRAIK